MRNHEWPGLLFPSVHCVSLCGKGIDPINLFATGFGRVPPRQEREGDRDI